MSERKHIIVDAPGPTRVLIHVPREVFYLQEEQAEGLEVYFKKLILDALDMERGQCAAIMRQMKRKTKCAEKRLAYEAAAEALKARRKAFRAARESIDRFAADGACKLCNGDAHRMTARGLDEHATMNEISEDIRKDAGEPDGIAAVGDAAASNDDDDREPTDEELDELEDEDEGEAMA